MVCLTRSVSVPLFADGSSCSNQESVFMDRTQQTRGYFHIVSAAQHGAHFILFLYLDGGICVAVIKL